MPNKKAPKLSAYLGIFILLVSLLLISFWTYWGINETFHEGWYHTSLLTNLQLTLLQYFSIPLTLTTLTLIAFNYPMLGSPLFLILGIVSFFFFHSPSGRIIISLPSLLLSVGYHFSSFSHQHLLTLFFLITPLTIILIFGSPQLYRVEHRLDDHDYSTRTINNYLWAPQGLGFPLVGTDWNTAINNCAHLNEGGTTLNHDRQDLWRLPTINELTSTMQSSTRPPDKESPLWNPHSQIIYYWTSESKDNSSAYLVSYNTIILARNKNSAAAYHGYRCLRNN